MILDQNLQQDQKNLQFRCPQCLKLFQVERKQIFSLQPEFHCTKCLCRFTFDYHPDAQQVQTKALALPQVGKLSQTPQKRKPSAELLACPKCQTLNPRTSTECYKCGVVLAKVEVIAKEKKVRVFPSLMKLWQDLLNDYTNIAKHVEFVDRCEDLQALPFALKKYKDLKEIQPHDSMANKMFDSVILRALSAQAQKYKKIPIMKRIHSLPWANMIRTSPLVLGGVLLVTGLLHYEARNLAGAGAALLALTLGFAYIHFGRIRFEDFWRE